MFKYNRILGWISGGVSSAVACYFAKKKAEAEGTKFHLAFCDTGSEHPDNYRFIKDVERWLGVEVEVLKNPKYANCMEVYEKTRYLVGPQGARCTVEMKKKPRQDAELRWLREGFDDLQVFGYTSEEVSRFNRFIEGNPLVNAWCPLVEIGMSKEDTHKFIANKGIQRPITYDQGFPNANCISQGCVKGGIKYWVAYMKYNPEGFQRMAEMERALGISILKDRRGGIRTKLFLDELNDPHYAKMSGLVAIPNFDCGIYCPTTFDDDSDSPNWVEYTEEELRSL